MSNRLANETSPYLLQHKDNPVDWYPWGEEAFRRAAEEDKPVFLSIGYSACHWCHVLAHESFEDEEIAALLNEHFISVKVDKEERPDVDSVYMTVCQAFTGSGGWPTSIFMTADKKPFFAGTYFPKASQGGMIGFRDLLLAIHEAWTSERDGLLQQSEAILAQLKRPESTSNDGDDDPIEVAVAHYQRLYDDKHGGFGRAPKFPTPHNLLFLLDHYERYGTPACLYMAEHTLHQMYRGGLFDHIGFGFCRYATDKRFLIPHFEKMLYDNALLILAYSKAYTVTKQALYLEVAEKTATYILREMTSPEGGFYSSQDADSEGVEGQYYLFTPDEILQVLGEEKGTRFNARFDVTREGNFEGMSLPNLLKSDPCDAELEECIPPLYEYRKTRHTLHRDEKILTCWNSLMIAALCELYRVSGKEEYRTAAVRADRFLREHLREGDTLYVSFHRGKRGVRGFLDDYAAYLWAQLSLYGATLEDVYRERAGALCDKALLEFGDRAGGCYLYGKDHEELILRPKETYDGAIPSGNSLMAYGLVRLFWLTEEERYEEAARRQLDFLAQRASSYPTGHAMFLLAMLAYRKPPAKITVVTDDKTDKSTLPPALPPEALIRHLATPTRDYPLKDGKTTYYVCQGHRCLPPTCDLHDCFLNGEHRIIEERRDSCDGK